jgi:hypothetical protein
MPAPFVKFMSLALRRDFLDSLLVALAEDKRMALPGILNRRWKAAHKVKAQFPARATEIIKQALEAGMANADKEGEMTRAALEFKATALADSSDNATVQQDRTKVRHILSSLVCGMCVSM